ncbi:MAG: type II toxin-antitoxin system RelE/ParE family toxin [Thermoanaerobaculia bacterium]|nr:type II toxin-antitoxin system RelE/ParE family toxin [Thermoanaerobaculia bacterium]
MKRKKRLRWHSQAVRDLELGHDFLHQHNTEAARRFASSILDATERLRTYPELGPVARDLRPEGRYRHWVCGRHRLIYRIDGEIVWILRVWDTRRDPADLAVGQE